MARYRAGDKIIINIRDIDKDAPAGLTFYEVDPADDGSQRFFSEAVLDKIMDMGADLYRCHMKGMRMDTQALTSPSE